MKRILFCMTLAIAFGIHCALAVPAYKGTAKMLQPDGTTVTISLHGDEYLHFYTTADGYSIVKDANNRYVYAELKDGQLLPTSRVAHDADARSAEELAYLSGVKKYLQPEMKQSVREEKEREMTRRAVARQKAMNREPQYDYSNFHGLIILVEYNDMQFSRDDIGTIINDFANAENYTGYSTQNPFTGSVRDYFNDISGGLFKPEFDVVGPVQVNRSQYYVNATDNSIQLMYDAINAVDSQVNFRNYDRDDDGVVDMVYLIFAGLGSNITGNDSRLLWPHAGKFYNPQTWSSVWKDGVRLGRYACSTELIPTQTGNIIDGIGTMCHEFSHVLGLMDTYDTDYDGSGGNSHHPGWWDIMAAGSYCNNSRTPVGYTLYERYAVGFATPEVINAEGEYTLENVSTNTGYRINTRRNKEFFLLENRQKDKWNSYGPGHGMLVFRVDSTNANVWRENKVNVNPNHNYFELLRADGYKDGDKASDPFPGSKKVRRLDNTTSPANLKSWSGLDSPWGLDSIKEINGVITFKVIDVNQLTSVKLPETAYVNVGFTYPLEVERYPETAPYTFEWKSDNEAVATVDAQGVVTGISVGEANISVKANDNDQLTAVCKVTVSDLEVLDNVAGFKNLPNNYSGILKLSNAQVLYVYNSDIYLRDATGSLLMLNTGLDVKANDLLNGVISGTRKIVNDIERLVAFEGVDYTSSINVSEGSIVEPHVLNPNQVNSSSYSDLITIIGAEMKRATVEGMKGVYVTCNGGDVRVFNTFGLDSNQMTMPKDYEGKQYDITGILTSTTATNGKVIMELALVTSPVETSLNSIVTFETSASALPVSIYTLDGRQVSAFSKSGLYIVKQGNKKKKVLVK